MAYDELGNPTSLGYPKCIANTTGQGGAKVCDDAGDIPAPDATATWTYNEGLMRSATFSLGPNATYNYHHNLQVANAIFGNSVIGGMGRGTNGMVRPHRYQVGLDINTVFWDSGSYAYDEAGNIKSIGGDSYTYDAANRLRSATVMQAGAGRTESYVYNTTDSMTQVTNDQFGTRPFNVSTVTNRLLGIGATANDWTYDGAGNTLTAVDGDFTYSWDAVNMLSRYLEAGKDFVSIYGPGDYRVWIEDRSTNTKYWALRGADGKILREYEVTPNGAGGDWTHQRDFLYGAEGIVASVDHDGTQLYYHSDHLGTPRLKTTADGLPFSDHHYYAYGLDANFSQIFEDGFETGDELGWEKDKDVLSVKYTGHERERFKNLDYMLGRHYSHVTNRFMSVDPARDGWNLYTYVQNSPIGLVDPDGLNAEVTCSGQACTVTVRAQVVVDPQNVTTIVTGAEFAAAAQNYWNNQTVVAPTGETLSFDVDLTLVNPGEVDPDMDALQVVDAAGRSNVQMTLGPTPVPDTGTIYTTDSTANPGGMAGTAAHETGHLMGLRDLYVRGELVPIDTSASADIMRHAQPTNGAPSAHWILSSANQNTTVQRDP